MPSIEKRSLIQLGKNLIITLPCGWTKFWNMSKGEKVQILYESVLIVIPPACPNKEELEKKIRTFLMK